MHTGIITTGIITTGITAGITATGITAIITQVCMGITAATTADGDLESQISSTAAVPRGDSARSMPAAVGV